MTERVAPGSALPRAACQKLAPILLEGADKRLRGLSGWQSAPHAAAEFDRTLMAWCPVKVLRLARERGESGPSAGQHPG